jgi:hypothetical protein
MQVTKNNDREVTSWIRNSTSPSHHRIISEFPVCKEGGRYHELDLNRSICVDARFFVGLSYVHQGPDIRLTQ